MKDYLRKMMIEHHSKSLAEWLEATPHLDPVEVKAVFNSIRRDELTVGEIEEASRW